MNAKEWQVVLYASVAHGWIHVLELAFAAVLVFVAREYGVGFFLLGVVANISAFAFGASAFPAGVLADQIGSRRLLAAAFLGAAAFSLLMSFSASIWMLGIGLAGLGIAIGMYHPAGLALISRGVRNQAIGFAYHGMVGNLGVALAPVLVGGIASTWGWRASYGALAVVALALAVAVSMASFQESSPLPLREGAIGSGTEQEDDPVEVEGRIFLLPLALLYTASMLNGFIYRGTLTFLPAYFLEKVHVSFLDIGSAALASSFVTLALLFGILGQYLGGLLAQRGKLEGSAAFVAVFTAASLLLMGATEEAFLVGVAAAFALVNFMSQPIYNSLISNYTPFRLRGRSYGVSFFFTFGMGSFAAGFSGYIGERLGISWVFVVLSALGILLLGIVVALIRISPLRAKPLGT